MRRYFLSRSLPPSSRVNALFVPIILLSSFFSSVFLYSPAFALTQDELVCSEAVAGSTLALACGATRCADQVVKEARPSTRVSMICQSTDSSAQCKKRCIDQAISAGYTCESLKKQCPPPANPSACEPEKVCRLIDDASYTTPGTSPCTYNISLRQQNGRIVGCEFNVVQFYCNYKCLAPLPVDGVDKEIIGGVVAY